MRITIEVTRVSRFRANLYIAIGKREWFIGPMAC
jgi:hypothetical protein